MDWPGQRDRFEPPLQLAICLTFWLAIAAAYTALVINYSLLRGKLCVYPFYDDVAYFEQALTLLSHYYANGVFGLIHGYIQSPPHSPFSGMLAVLAYAICGPREWAPYAANGLIVFGVILFVNAALDGVSFSKRLLIVLFVLTVPVMCHAVDAYRPDIASGACAAAGAALLARGPFSATKRKTRILAGVLFGAALLFKPPTLPLTLALLIAAAFAALVQDRYVRGISIGQSLSLRKWSECLLPAVLIPLPHYALTFNYYFKYVTSEIFGETREVWSRHATWQWHLRYFLDGEGGQLMLGQHLYLLGLLCIGGIVYAVIRGDSTLRGRFGGLGLIVFIAFLVPTVVASKQEFYGTAFYFALILMALEVVLMACRRPGRHAFVFASALFVLGALGAKFPPHRYDSGSTVVAARNRVVDDIYHALRAEEAKPSSEIYLTSSGYFNRSVLNYVALIRDLYPLRIVEQPFTDDLAIHAREINRADFVIASERGNSEAWEGFLKSGTVQDQTLELVRNDPQFELADRFPTHNAKSYYLFRRAKLLESLEPVEGLAPLEGPLPLLHLHEFRWGLGPRTRLRTTATDAGEFRMIGLLQSAVSGQEVVVRLDGKECARLKLPSRGVAVHLDCPLALTRGVHDFEFDYSNWDHNQYDKPVAVMFRALRLIHQERHTLD